MEGELQISLCEEITEADAKKVTTDLNKSHFFYSCAVTWNSFQC